MSSLAKKAFDHAENHENAYLPRHQAEYMVSKYIDDMCIGDETTYNQFVGAVCELRDNYVIWSDQ
jgi:hypothetical protein